MTHFLFLTFRRLTPWRIPLLAVMFLLCMISSHMSFAQHALGVVNSNNAGVMSVFMNPANIADSRFWFDINVASVNVNFNQNVLRTKSGLGGIIRNDSNMLGRLPNMFSTRRTDNNAYQSSLTDIFSKVNFDRRTKGAYGSADILGPSFMFNIFKKVGIALSTRARAEFNILDAYQGNVLSQFNNFMLSTNRNTLVQDYNLGNLKAVYHRFAELGLTIAAPLMQRGGHFLKGGVTFKRLVGYDYTVFRTLRADVQLQPNVDGMGGSASLQGRVENLNYRSPYQLNGIGDYINYFFNGALGADRRIPTGWGFDLGFVYEYRPKHKQLENAALNTTNKYLHEIEDYTENKYFLKWSVALKDFGFIRYGAEHSTGFFYDAPYRVTAPLTTNPSGIFTGQSREVLEQSQQAFTAANFNSDWKQAVTFYLPATFVTQLDVNVWKDVYVNATFFGNLMTRYAFDTRTPTLLSIAPRFERKHFDIALPIIYNMTYSQLKVGLGFNVWQIFYMGTDDLALFFGGFRGANLYAGFRVPMRKRKPFVRVFDDRHKFEPVPYVDKAPAPATATRPPIPAGAYQPPKALSQNPHRSQFERGALKKKNRVQYNEARLRDGGGATNNVQTIQQRAGKRRNNPGGYK